MFVDICMSNYMIQWELQHSYFLKDCLYEEISYELKESKVIIYRKLDNGIYEEITLDELIFYIHTEVAFKIEQDSSVSSINPTPQTPHGHFYRLFKNIDNIKKAVENMKIILKYDDSSDEDEKDEKDEDKKDKKSENNKSLAF